MGLSPDEKLRSEIGAILRASFPGNDRTMALDCIVNLVAISRSEATEAQARRIAQLEGERDEAREVSGVFAEYWPYGQDAARDEVLRIALCAVPSPTAILPKEPSR